MGKYPWIDAADAAGELDDDTCNALSAHLIPGEGGKLITLPPETWRGAWRLIHMHKYLSENGMDAPVAVEPVNT